MMNQVVYNRRIEVLLRFCLNKPDALPEVFRANSHSPSSSVGSPDILQDDSKSRQIPLSVFSP